MKDTGTNHTYTPAALTLLNITKNLWKRSHLTKSLKYMGKNQFSHYRAISFGRLLLCCTSFENKLLKEKSVKCKLILKLK